MKTKLLLALIALLAIGLMFVGCPTEVKPPKKPGNGEGFTPPSDWVGFNEEEMLAAGFYAGDGVTDTGSITKKSDGTFEVRVKTVTTTDARASVVWFTFPDVEGEEGEDAAPRVIFRNGWYASLTLPSNAQYKPVKIQIVPSSTDNGGSPDGWPASQDTDITGDIPATFDADGNVIGKANFHWGTEETVDYNFKTIAIWVFWPPVGVEDGEDYTFIINDIKVLPHDPSEPDPDLEGWTPPAIDPPNLTGWMDFPVDTTASTFDPSGGSIVAGSTTGTYTVTAKTTTGDHTEIVFKGTDDFAFKGGYILSITLPNQTAESTTKPSRIYVRADSNWNSAADIQQAFKWVQGKVDAYYIHEDFSDHATIVLSIYWHSDVVADQDYVFTINSFKVKEEGVPPVETPVIHETSALADKEYGQGSTATALNIVPVWTSNSSSYTYQWYSNTTDSNTGGTILSTETAASFTPPTTTVGIVYYYCVVTYPTEGTSVTTRAVKIEITEGEPTGLELWTPTAVAEPNGYVAFPEASILAATFYPAGGTITKSGDTYTVTAKTRLPTDSTGQTAITFTATDFAFKTGYYLSVTLPTDPTYKPIRVYPYISQPVDWNTAVDLNAPEDKFIGGKVDLHYTGTVGASTQITLNIYWASDVVAGQDYVFTISSFKVAEESTEGPPPETPGIHETSTLTDEIYAKDATATALNVVPVWTSNSSSYTYQWYSNTTDSNTGGTIINSQTAASFTPPTDTLGIVYYYCVVTYPTAGTSATTRAVKITVSDDVEPSEGLEPWDPEFNATDPGTLTQVASTVITGATVPWDGSVTVVDKGGDVYEITVKNRSSGDSRIYFTNSSTFSQAYLSLTMPEVADVQPTRLIASVATDAAEEGFWWGSPYDKSAPDGKYIAGDLNILLDPSASTYGAVILYIYLPAGDKDKEYTFTLKALKVGN